MDFLDPKKERQNQLKLMIGYALIAIAIAGTALVLLYQAYGYALNQQGQILQNGLLFISSQPTGSSIYLNNQLFGSTTNTRAIVPAGKYDLRITRSGYRNWERPVYVAGGDVQHFDYPFLFPSELKQATEDDISTTPTLVTQSLDQRWLLMDRPGSTGSFTLYDLQNPKKPVSSVINLPSGFFTASDGSTDSWALEEWSSDNRHVVLVHTYESKGATDHEYVLLDTQNPSDSINLTYSLNLSQDDTLTLFNNQTAQVFVYNPDDRSLQRINVSDGSLVSKLDRILAYKAYGDNRILYVTDQALNGKEIPNQVSVVLQDGQQTYTLRTLPAGASSYVLNLAQYSGDWYVAAGASNDNAVYIYKDPESVLATGLDSYPAPWRRLDIQNPNYLEFSNNTQFLLAESGQQFVVYDLENVIQYSYATTQLMDQPQTHATWMDGDRIMYVSNGKLVVFDYDYRNQQTLMDADPAFLPYFDSSYTYVFDIAPEAATQKDPGTGVELTSTSMLTPADQ